MPWKPITPLPLPEDHLEDAFDDWSFRARAWLAQAPRQAPFPYDDLLAYWITEMEAMLPPPHSSWIAELPDRWLPQHYYADTASTVSDDQLPPCYIETIIDGETVFVETTDPRECREMIASF